MNSEVAIDPIKIIMQTVERVLRTGDINQFATSTQSFRSASCRRRTILRDVEVSVNHNLREGPDSST
eukprot:m.1633241 g.1633241  ORF g.1633241 m.1633241 type:complete len:67 (-) comp25406_c0_seq26:7188-7388(-)